MKTIALLLLFLVTPSYSQWMPVAISSANSIGSIEENFRRASLWSNKKLDKYSNDVVYGTTTFKAGIKFSDGSILSTAGGISSGLTAPATFYIVKTSDYLVAPASFTYLSNASAFLTAPATSYWVKSTDYLVAPASFTYLSNPNDFLTAPSTFYIVKNTDYLISPATFTIITSGDNLGSHVATMTITGNYGASISTLVVTGSQFYVGGSTLVVAGGRVGVGTNAPAYPIQIKVANNTTDNIYLNFLMDSITAGKIYSLAGRDSGGVYGALGWAYDGTTGTTDLKLHSMYNSGYNTSSAIPFIFKGNGRMGIGTTTPGSTLHVAGDETVTGSLTASSMTATGEGSFGGNLGVGTNAPIGKLQIQGTTLNNTYFGPEFGNTINFNATVNGNSSGFINYTGYNGGFTQFRDLYIDDGKAGTVMFVDGSAASVGIGTDAPGYKLDVQGGDINTSGSYKINGVAVSGLGNMVLASTETKTGAITFQSSVTVNANGFAMGASLLGGWCVPVSSYTVGTAVSNFTMALPTASFYQVMVSLYHTSAAYLTGKLNGATSGYVNGGARQSAGSGTWFVYGGTSSMDFTPADDGSAANSTWQGQFSMGYNSGDSKAWWDGSMSGLNGSSAMTNYKFGGSSTQNPTSINFAASSGNITAGKVLILGCN